MKQNLKLQSMTSSLTRRQVLGAAAAGALAWAMPRQVLAADAAKEIAIGVQLYSFRGACEKDVDAVLEQVAKMGFAGVEFYGGSYFKYNGKAKELRKKLDDLNLKSPSIHTSVGTLKGDALKAAIEFSQTIGGKFLIVSSDGNLTNPDRSKAEADLYNQAAEILKPAGMACGFHNHEAEFTKKEGDKTAFDLFAERTTKEVVLQQDVGHTLAAGTDPVAVIKKYPGRFRCVHFAPHASGAGKKAIIGQDSVDWKACIAACREVGGTEWFFVEQEAYPDGKSAAECTKTSLDNLKKIIAELG